MDKKYIVLWVFVLVVAVGVIATVAYLVVYRPGRVAVIPVADQVVGISIDNPKENSVITSPLKITGWVYGNGWTGFEGQVGTVELIGMGDQVVARGILTATTDWMQLPTRFESVITFTDPVPGGVVSLLFHNENPSGEASRDKNFAVTVQSKNGIKD
jgi:hypothetical protein